MLQEWRHFILAVGFFTRIPVPDVKNFQETDLNHATKYFPLVGILVGVAAGLAFILINDFFPQDIAVILSMLTSIYMTGAFHEDGLADAIDGLGGGWSKEQVVAIMQDSRIGSYGAVAMILSLLLKFTVLSHLPSSLMFITLISGHSLSRLYAVLVMFTQSYVKTNGKSKPIASKLSVGELALATTFGLSPLCFLGIEYLIVLVPVSVVWVLFSLKLKMRIGGYTGDCLGAMQQLTELTFYLGCLCLALRGG